MITEVPSAEDFERSGLSFLNLAWQTVFDLLLSLEAATSQGAEPEEMAYWRAAQTPLSTSVSLFQQGFEFLLKSRIASVSPYLLLGKGPRDWPSNCASQDTPFAEFFTVDAQDLVKIHNTVLAPRIPDSIKELFERMRQLRNSFMHTVDRRISVEAKPVAIAILEVYSWHSAASNWIDSRRTHIALSHDTVLFESYGQDPIYLLAREMLKAVDYLEPAEIVRLLGFDRKQRRYLCPECMYACSDTGIEPNLAFLRPKNPESTNVHCYLCARNFVVIRRHCGINGCRGNVIWQEEGMCLTCGGHLELEDETG